MKILNKLGNEALMKNKKTAFVCSRKVPDRLEYLVGKWILGLSPERDCVMCGNQSPMERAVFTVLLQRKIPTILMLAEAMHDNWGDDVRQSLAEGRLLIATHCDPNVHNVTARSAFDRNILMMSLASLIFVGYCTKGGKLERALAGFDNVEYLENGQPWLIMPENKNPEPKGYQPEQTKLNAWSRRLRQDWGTMFFDFNDSGAETYFKITHSVSANEDYFSRQKLFFDFKELSSFRDAMAFIAEKTNAGEAVPPELTVESLSGDITFSLPTQEKSQLLTTTQDKAYNDGRHRINTIRLGIKELPEFIGYVEEALAEWVKQ